MDSLSAYAMGQAHRHSKQMVFDWKKAAKLIRESGATEASAGLAGDWEWTGGIIFQNGKPVAKDDTYVYLSSTWATPELEINGETIDCWTYSNQWDENTYWPKSALDILHAGVSDLAATNPDTKRRLSPHSKYGRFEW